MVQKVISVPESTLKSSRRSKLNFRELKFSIIDRTTCKFLAIPLFMLYPGHSSKLRFTDNV